MSAQSSLFTGPLIATAVFDPVLKLARGLGATIVTVPTLSVFDGLCAHIVETRATAVVIGRSRRSWWFELRHGPVVDQLVYAMNSVPVHVVPVIEQGATEAEPAKPRPRAVSGMAAGIGLVALTTAAAVSLKPILGANSMDLIYLLPVVVTATLFGLRASLVASFAATHAYNFLFLPPLYTLTISDPQNVVTLLVPVVVATVASQLTGRLKREANIGARTATANAALAAFGQRLATVSDEAGTAAAVCEKATALLNVATVLFTRREGRLAAIGAAHPNRR